MGPPVKGVSPEIVKWTTNREAPTPELKALALRALDRVRKNSELKDLWLEADGLNLNNWTAAQDGGVERRVVAVEGPR
jgi:Domain of unknown function (DUF4259)